MILWGWGWAAPVTHMYIKVPLEHKFAYFMNKGFTEMKMKISSII